MNNQSFKNRVYGCIIIKSINSNFNADFTHQPRTLPDGIVYSTDKALKYSIRNYFNNYYKSDNIFYTKRYNDSLNPLSLDETYIQLFGSFPEKVKKSKKQTNTDDKNDKMEINKLQILQNLLKCLDIRLFGATFAGEANISIHGPLQINHGVNRFPENEIYSEDILSPFRNTGKKDDKEKSNDEEKQMSTKGNQTNLQEGHYVFHYSINPKNIEEYNILMKANNLNTGELTISDILKLKEAMNKSVSFLDSSRKINTDNETSIFIQLKEGSKKVIPSITELIDISKNDRFTIIDCEKLFRIIELIKDTDIEIIEVYYNPINVIIKNLEKNSLIKHFNIINNSEI